MRLQNFRGVFLGVSLFRNMVHCISGEGICCRFQPVCSVYAVEAVEKFGWLRGVKLTVGRLFRCHPWGANGYDPVPNTSEAKEI